MRKILGIGLVAGMCISLSAQEKESDILPVTVHGKFMELPMRKVNENISVINKEEIASLPAKSIEEVLATIAGFDIRRRGGNGVQADVSLRGSSFEQVLILINGVRMNDSQTGHNSMSLPVDLSSVEKIEVIKGPAARRFGQNAYAGVVNIVTKPGKETEITIGAEGGDFSSYKLRAAASVGSNQFSNLIQASSDASDGYRRNTDYKINNIFYQNEYRFTHGKISLQAGFQEKKFGANGFYSTPTATEQYEETQASIVSVNAQKQLGNFKLNGGLYWRRGQDLYLFNREKPEIYRNMHIGNNVGGELNGSFNSSLGTTGLGVELRKEFLASNNLGHRERFLSQLFLEHHFSFYEDKLQVSPGVSWAHYTTAGDFFYPGLDVGYAFNPNHKIYGNISKVNRIPTFTDLYYKSKTEEGNSDLNPESAVATELGYRFENRNFNAKLSFFTRDTENAIDWTKARAEDIWKAENIGDLFTKGLEAELSQNFNSFFKSYSIAYTYLDTDVGERAGGLSRYVVDHLRHQFIFKLENRLFKNLSNQLTYRYNERVNSGSYQLLDEKLYYHFNAGHVYLLINNLTNTKYIETFGVPMAGRWFHIGFTYKITL